MKISKSELRNEYDNYILRKYLILLILVLILAFSVILSTCIGSSNLAVKDVVMTLLGQGTKQMNSIIFNIRLPRIVAGLVVGASLALAGCIMQNVLKNPLASSSTLGVSQGAAFGAAFAIVVLDAGAQVNASTSAASAVSISNPYTVTICAFIGGFTTTLVIIGLSRVAHVSPATMILAGVALSSLFTGATSIIQYFADDVKVASVVYWTFGDLGRTGWKEIRLIFIIFMTAFLLFMANRWNYNAMETGPETANSLGVPVDRLLILSMLFCSLMAAVSTAFVGTISFIGLVAVHMIRKLIGNDYRFLIPASALTGSIVLVLADLLSRVVIMPSILPIGALTSFLGAPVFILMIFKRRNVSND